jgi:hypothetical protein
MEREKKKKLVFLIIETFWSLLCEMYKKKLTGFYFDENCYDANTK